MSDQEDRERRAREYVRRVVKGAKRSLSKEEGRYLVRVFCKVRVLSYCSQSRGRAIPTRLKFCAFMPEAHANPA